MNKTINWGMIGVGDVTRVKSAPSFSKLPDSVLLAVTSRREDMAKAYAKENNVERCYASVDELLRDADVEIVYVATPPSSHLEYALKVIAAGKHVYLEKPMALNYEECKEINEAAKEAGLKVFVAYYRRALDYFLQVKELVDSGMLGELVSVHCDQLYPVKKQDLDADNLPWRLQPEISGGGYFHDIGCHALDILFYLLGDPVEVTGSSWNSGGLYDADDTVGAILRLEPNVLVTANWSFIVPEEHQRDKVVVVGEKGSVSFSVFSFEDIESDINGEKKSYHFDRPEHIQMPFISSINEELRNQGSCPSTGESASVSSWIMDIITE